MKRQPYWPKVRAQQPLWLNNFANMLEVHGPAVPLDPAVVTSHALNARRTAHVLGPWNTFVREIGPAASAIQQEQCYGEEGAALALPVFTAPAPPAGVVAVAAGALNRIFSLAKIIKSSPGFTEAMGLALGIKGPEDTSELLIPTFKLKVEDGIGCQCVRASFEKGDNDAVYIESRRGPGVAFSFLAVDTESPYVDARPLLVAGQPEVREYRMRMYENAQPIGDWSPVQRATVGPA